MPTMSDVNVNNKEVKKVKNKIKAGKIVSTTVYHAFMILFGLLMPYRKELSMNLVC